MRARRVPRVYNGVWLHRKVPPRMWPEGLHEVRPGQYVVVLNDRPRRGIESRSMPLAAAKATYLKARCNATHLRDVGGANDGLMTLAVQWAVLRKAVSDSSKVSLAGAARRALNFENKAVSVGDQIATATGVQEFGRIVNERHVDATGEIDKRNERRKWVETPPRIMTAMLNSPVGATWKSRTGAVMLHRGAFQIKTTFLTQKVLVEWAVIRLERLIKAITKVVDEWRCIEDVAAFLGAEFPAADNDCARAKRQYEFEHDATTKAVWAVVQKARTKAASAVLNLGDATGAKKPVLPPCMRDLVDGSSPDAAEFVHMRRFHWLVLTASVVEKCGLGRAGDVFPVRSLGAITERNNKQRLNAIKLGYKSVRRAGPMAKCSVVAAKTLAGAEATIKCPYATKAGGCAACHMKHGVASALDTDAVTVGDVAAAMIARAQSKQGKAGHK